MPTIECDFEEVELENDSGRKVDGVKATCGECGHTTESFGTGENSKKRCLVMMREECPNGMKNNFYKDSST